MINEKKINEFFRVAMDRMFIAVGFDGFDEDFTKQKNWYQKREWSETQEKEFRNWFINECSETLRMNKKHATLEDGYFLLMWGWKTKREDIYEEKKTAENEEHKVNENV